MAMKIMKYKTMAINNKWIIMKIKLMKRNINNKQC